MKRSLYYSVNMLCAKLGYADRHVLLQLFRAHCMNMFGCELWNVAAEKRALKELCVAYHSCIKKLIRLPRWVGNHEMCDDMNMLPCHMLISSRQLCFWKRIICCENRIVMCARNASGGNGPHLSNILRLRQDYGIMNMDLASTGKAAIQNIFRASLKRIVAERRRDAEAQRNE